MRKSFTCKVVALLIIFMLIFTLVGCGGNSAEQQPEEKIEPIKIGIVGSKTGPLNAYHKQFMRGLELGLQHVTGGTKKIADREILFFEEDDESKADVAKQKAIKLLEEDEVDFIVGVESSTNAIAVAPLAEEYKKIFIIDPAVADGIIGASWNKYIFKSGRSSGQDAAASAAAIAKPGVKIATLGQDNAFGRDGCAAFKREAEKLGATVIHEEYVPTTATDFTPNLMKIVDSKPEYLWIVWAGTLTPWQQIADLKITDKGIKLSSGVPDQAALPFMDKAVGMIGMCVYHPNLPQSAEARKVHDWLVEEHQKRFDGEMPDLFTPSGYNVISAIKTAVEKNNGSTNADELIPIMEGMSFPTPKGTFTFRKEDHLALQPLYVVELVMGKEMPEPKLIRELSPEDTAPPIMNGR